MKRMAALGFLVLLACESPTASEADLNVQTGRASYTVDVGGIGQRIAVDIRYTNTLAEQVHIGHCGGIPSILYKRVGREWIVAGSTGTLDCGRITAVVGAGATFTTTLSFEGAPRGSNTYPQFYVDDLSGTYRIVLSEVVVGRQENPITSGTLIPERLRVSNTFQVVE